MPVRNALSRLLVGALVASSMSAPVAAQTNSSLLNAASSLPVPAQSASGYDQPPKEILDVMRAPSPPWPVVSPAQDTILLVSLQDYPSIARVATPFLRLAGVRVEPRNHSKHDTPGGYGITPCARAFDLVHIADTARIPVALPDGACPGWPIWAADGKRFAFVNIALDSVELWIGDGKNGEIHKVPGVRLNPMLNAEMQWMPDQTTLLVKLVPEGMGALPSESTVPEGPSIQETEGEKGESSTYENRDTLNNKHDEDLFDYFAASQLAFVDTNSGAIAPFGKTGDYESLAPAPDGRHIFVATIHKPYSYVTTYDRFPREIEVWDATDRSRVHVSTIASLPLADRVPIGGVPLGPRDFSWRATAPATLVWAEALDGGDWNVTVPARDKILLSKAPFTSPGVEITRTVQRYAGLSWSEKPSIALLTEYDDNRHWTRTFIIDVDDPAVGPLHG
jgi:dipeptidyl aminopeptidase/acylaminoacyl peptidase